MQANAGNPGSNNNHPGHTQERSMDVEALEYGYDTSASLEIVVCFKSLDVMHFLPSQLVFTLFGLSVLHWLISN